MNIYPVIMAGGSGTRFWPLSRQKLPKQFLPLADNKTLIRATADRVKALAKAKNTLVVCGPVHAPLVKKFLPQLPKGNVLVEPVARNTAPAIALATLHVLQQDEKGILVVLPSDHHVADIKGFNETLRQAAEVAAKGDIVTVGIKPIRPETGYGYIRVGAVSDGAAHKVAAFVEKPDVETARRYVDSGEYLWNGGIFVFRADVMRDALKKHMPDLWKGLGAVAKVMGKRTMPKTLARAFPKLPSVSIDYGVAEKAENMAVIPGDFGWSDVGSFAALPEVRPLDARGNVVSGKGAFVIDSDGCVVLAGDKPLAVIGMTDVVVVDAGDAILVVPKDKAQDVRKAVDALKAKKLLKSL